MPVLRGLKPPSKGNYTAYTLQSVVLPGRTRAVTIPKFL